MDLETAFMASRLIIAAERLQVFRELHGIKLSAPEIEKRLKIHPRYLTFFLDALVSMSLLRKKAGLYWNSALADKYFIRERPLYWTRQFSAECVDVFEAFTVLEKILKSGKNPWTIRRKKKQSYIESMKKHPEEARDFTQMLFYYHKTDAEALAKFLDLHNFRSLLDVGGGSGVMSIAIAKKNQNLRACILDIEPVCAIARENVRKEGLSNRVEAVAGDFRKELPRGYNVILCSDIGVVPKALLRKAYRSLSPEGMIALVDRFLSEDRTEPLDKLLYHLGGSEFGMETKQEIAAALKSCDFRKIKIHNLHRDLWVITALKS